jgi:hypothetical protein
VEERLFRSSAPLMEALFLSWNGSVINPRDCHVDVKKVFG